MSDYGQEYTDKRIKEIEGRLSKLYKEAEKDINAKIKDFNSRYEAKNKIHLQEVKDGKMSESEYKEWLSGQVFQGKQWKAKKEQIANTLYNTNVIATKIVNGQVNNVFATNANYMAYTIEKSANANLSFGLYDSATVANLVKNEPNLLPMKKLKKGKDKAWNMKKISNQVALGIIQGEKLDQVADRIARVTASQNKSQMLTHARTTMTGAQNAGRQQSINDATKRGIRVKKQWMSTLDEHTRTTHQELDGQSVEPNKPFRIGGYTIMYPGDPHAHPAMVYNCRCTMVQDLVDFPEEYQRRDNISGIPIKNMTYKEWKKAKSPQEHKKASSFVWNKNYAGIPERVYGKADTSDALFEIENGKANSLSEYLDEDGNLTPEREALHRQIIDNYLADKTPEEGTAIMTMMGGGPASGKSSVLKSGLYKLPSEEHSITIDPDDIKTYLPGYLEKSKTDSTAASFYHEESSMLAKQLANTCFTENFNVTYDGTGDGSVNSVMKKINGAKEHGYKVNGMYVTVDTDEALKRNQSRYDHAVAKGESPRLVPDEYVINCHKKVTQISMEVSDKFDNISLYDNNGSAGETKLIATGGNGNKLSAIKGEEEAFRKFLEKGK